MCKHFGPAVKMVKYKGKEWTELHECAIHPRCFNTKYSIICETFNR